MNKIARSFLIVIAIIVMTGCKSVQKENYAFYVGTYTQKDSKGIYKYTISSGGVLKKIGLAVETNNPSFLAKTKDNLTLLAVEETDENGTGFVNSFKIVQDSLVFVSKSKSGGAHPCFITVNDKDQVLVANYTGGNVGYLQVDNQNGLTNLLGLQQHVGKGTTSRQEGPHAHSSWFHPSKKEVISVDLGTNQLWFSAIDTIKNEFVFTRQKTLQMEVGAGPRHVTFHPNNKWIYVLNELNNTVSLVKEKENTYYVESSIATLPEDFTAYSKAADIHISADGQFLYASNRGHESIVMYTVNPKNGTLKTIGFQPVLGKHPRNFSLSPNEEFLIVANQDTNNIVSFKRNSKTGKLTFVSEIAAPMPVCILF
jgi:6-phosphogluconolactonase